MTQTLVIEIGEGLPVREQEARQIGTLLYALAETDEGIARLRLEIEAEAVLSLPLAGVEAGGEPTEAEREEAEEEAAIEAVRMNPGTRRWTLAAILYHAPEPLTTGDIADLSDGEAWEMDQSAASAELYNMYQEDLVDRAGSPYEYELTDDGEVRLSQRSREEDAPIEPNPFETDEGASA